MAVKPAEPRPRRARADTMVAAGILASRVSGLARTTIFAHFFGLQNDAADAFSAALRIPNLLQNLFGEGALSGSFIPVHSGLRGQGRDAEAAQTARTVFALLMLLMSVLVLIGELAAPLLTRTIAGGFTGKKLELTILLVRILFPGAALLVAAAWCLGVLNSHGKFLLSYASGVAWNAGIIGALLIFGPARKHDLESLAVMLAWGSVAGSLLQFAVQAHTAFSLSRGGGPLGLSEPVRRTLREFAPVMISRGAVQISAFIDQYIASYLPKGAVTGLTATSLIYTLPVSLFGISVSAAQLPALSRDAALEETTKLRQRIDAGLERLAFFVVPSAVAFAAIGDVIAGVILQHGQFRAQDTRIVWGMLAGSSIGLVASTQSRLYSVAHYALGDTKKPLRFALVRIALVTVLGYLCALVIPPRIGVPAMWGTAGLTGSAGVAGWIEFALLRRSMEQRIGPTGLPASRLAILWGAALAGAAVAWGVKLVIPWSEPLIRGALILPAFGVTYLLCTALLGLDVRRHLLRD